MADPLSEPPVVTIAGLEIPQDLVPVALAALQAHYPTLVAGATTPEEIVQRVMEHWVTQLVIDFVSNRAVQEASRLTAAAQEQHALHAKLAREKVVLDCKRIKRATKGVASEVPEEG